MLISGNGGLRDQCFRAGDAPPLHFADSHPAFCAAFGSAGDWLAVGASLAGPGHRREYRARDDAFALMAADTLLVAAVADGVGGELYSRWGAALSVNEVCHQMLRQMNVAHRRRSGIDDFDQLELSRKVRASGVPTNMPALESAPVVRETLEEWTPSGTYSWHWHPYRRLHPGDLFEEDDDPPAPLSMRDALASAFRSTRASLLSYARTLSVRPAQLRSTLLVTAVDIASGQLVRGQVGDGAILGLDSGALALPRSDRDEDDNPFTLASEDWEQGLRVSEHPSMPMLLMSDGAEEFFPEALEECRSLLGSNEHPSSKSLRLLQWLRDLHKSDARDDRTIVAMFPRTDR
jgi:serine/threonine protein phosphatase PrpC